jgi:hypothetical protein
MPGTIRAKSLTGLEHRELPVLQFLACGGGPPGYNNHRSKTVCERLIVTMIGPFHGQMQEGV